MSFYTLDILGPVRKQAQAAADGRRQVKIGFITSYNADTYAVRVRLEPESTANETAGISNPVVETNWLPLYRPFGGNGWGVLAPPHADPNKPYGDMCLVLWPDNGHGVALTGFFNNKELPYTGTTPSNSTGSSASKPADGELVIVHKTGSWIKLLNDGSVYIKSSSGSFVFVDNDGDVDIHSSAGSDATFDSSGNVTISSQPGAELALTSNAKLADSSGDAVQVGGITATNGIVRFADLQQVINQILVGFTLCQSGPGVHPTITAVASTTCSASG